MSLPLDFGLDLSVTCRNIHDIIRDPDLAKSSDCFYTSAFDRFGVATNGDLRGLAKTM